MCGFRSYAVIPAAGQSRRMGKEKLLLPVEGQPLILRVLQAWIDSRVDEVVVVVRQNNKSLLEICLPFQVHLVATSCCPSEMRDTLEIGLDFIAEHFSPNAHDVWLAAPADMPGLSAPLIDHLLANYDKHQDMPLVPRVSGRSGHPVLLPWSKVNAFRQLPRGQGLNSLVKELLPKFVDLADPGASTDLDTPTDYRLWLGQQRK